MYSGLPVVKVRMGGSEGSQSDSLLPLHGTDSHSKPRVCHRRSLVSQVDIGDIRTVVMEIRIVVCRTLLNLVRDCIKQNVSVMK